MSIPIPEGMGMALPMRGENETPEPMVISCSCGNASFHLGYVLGGQFGLPFVVVCTRCKKVHGYAAGEDPLKKMAETFTRVFEDGEEWKKRRKDEDDQES